MTQFSVLGTIRRDFLFEVTLSGTRAVFLGDSWGRFMRRLIVLIPLAFAGCSQYSEIRREQFKAAASNWFGSKGTVDPDRPLLEDAVNYQLAKQNRQVVN